MQGGIRHWALGVHATPSKNHTGPVVICIDAPAQRGTMRWSMNEKIISIIDKLIAVCNDGAEGFQLAANEIHASLLQSLFRGYSLQRSRFAGDLQAAASALGKSVPAGERSPVDPLAVTPTGAVPP